MTRAQIKTDIIRNKYIYIMALPVVAYYIIFHYMPMYGAIIAFKEFNPALGIIRSPWVGLKHFKDFFEGVYFWRLIRNTLLISIYSLVWGFPAPIILALLLNEVKNNYFKRTVQTISYLPHFISLVVVCGIIKDFTSTDGVINDIIEFLGGERTNFLMIPEWFRPIYVGSGIWQEVGWGSIIYLAAITNIDPQLYEAATIDGASRWKQTWHITLPGIVPTIVILLILRLGGLMSVGFEKIILLYNSATMETADVISSYVYRRGLLDFDYSFSAAVGLFNSVINLILITSANKFSRKISETSLW
ncbi:ABC transporter permease subunit [Caldicoprobacter algeriensis]|uniref:ABC transporter permease n=1 Tax=Caldicoprobacter algeriensis TaxID=699281 RepID=UPI002079E8F0|nr:ABC transporter permease subunit [Caldicoprobacter algeriensis]MCM8901801.1 ABC transporter permease subunit [Caldicoprobacter algeriensis]